MVLKHGSDFQAEIKISSKEINIYMQVISSTVIYLENLRECQIKLLTFVRHIVIFRVFLNSDHMMYDMSLYSLRFSITMLT